MTALLAIALLGTGYESFSQQQMPTASLQSCGRADPTYIRTANETGGIPMFLQPSEVAKSFHLIRESTLNNVSTVLWATGSLTPQPRTIEIPVNSAIQRITFTFSFDSDSTRLTLTSPSGKPITTGASGIEVTELHCGRIVTEIRPEIGMWRATITGKGRFWVRTEAQSELYFVDAEFVREAGRPGHEGLFRIEGQPVAGKPATLRATVSTTEARSTEFYLVTEGGERIQKADMRAVSTSDDMNEYLGTVQLPSLPFRLAVAGLDANNAPYQRFFSNLFHAESVEVSWNRTDGELAAGSTTQTVFTVRNTGEARTFQLTVTDAHQFVSRVEPREFVLGAGQSVTIRLDLKVPAGTRAGTSDDVIVIATSTSGSSTSNSSIARYTIPNRWD